MRILTSTASHSQNGDIQNASPGLLCWHAGALLVVLRWIRPPSGRLIVWADWGSQCASLVLMDTARLRLGTAECSTCQIYTRAIYSVRSQALWYALTERWRK